MNLLPALLAAAACAQMDDIPDAPPSDLPAEEGETIIENPSRETCNNRDDDNNGLIDDGAGENGELIEACTTECGSGWKSCLGGEWWPCDAPQPNADGTCACTGGADRRCETPCGVGTQSCVDGVWSACSAGTGGPEICDNSIDDDCDGEIDEGDCGCVDGMSKPCGDDTGECTAGTQRCEDGEWGDCSGYLGPRTEQCNGLDDDCDGVVDNNMDGDRYEENDSCVLAARVPGAEEAGAENSFMGNCVPDGEDDWFMILTQEGTHLCVPFTEQCCFKLYATISIEESGTLPFMCLYAGGCSGSQSCTTAGQDTLVVSWSGTCGAEDGKDFALKVAMPTGLKNCNEYTVRYHFTLE